MKNKSLLYVTIALDSYWREVIDINKEGHHISIRSFEEIDAFAAEVCQNGRFQIRVCFQDELTESATDGLLICEEPVVPMLAERWSLSPMSLMTRTILLNVDRAKTAHQIEELGAAGAIEGNRYWTWRTERNDSLGGRLFGRKDIASKIKASWTRSSIWESERYCLMEHETHPTLPLLLAAYLDAYHVFLDSTQ
ncbi:hypothetical protein MK805_01965 [Shimazuella sp. AN120528]|uniref:hypothetical protein n=1 Tax=Shimazuella soli TaxID=1892854 RepID=UPI001F0F8093|nr:hypothetical protein [Shimazuella soli]MCH5583734.1 hypothetical protein [Shimazuella soli]